MVEPHPRADSVECRRRAYVETYGCQMNISDGEIMRGLLSADGYELVDRVEDADVILVNTCAIREHAERRVLGRVGQLYQFKKLRPEVVLGVTGCMAQRIGPELLERAPYVDLVLGPDAYRGLPAAIRKVRPDWRFAAGGPRDPVEAPPARGEGAGNGAAHSRARAALPVLPAGAAPAGGWSDRMGTRFRPELAAATGSAVRAGPGGTERLALLDFEPHENYEGLEVRRSESASAWVPIQRGCNYRCTYCIVPYVRGPEKNRHPRRVLDEVRGLAATGVSEVTLLGQTVNSYRSGDWTFPRLLSAVARVDGIRRVRFTSPHPNDVTEALVEVMAIEPAVCEQLHLPLQAGHDRTLKRMLRRYTVADFLGKVALVRAAIPDIALSTDVIVAFPGETDEEYRATLDVMREVRFDDAFLYRYSLRDGTPATRLDPAEFVPDGVAAGRLEELIALQRSIQADIARSELGRIEEVLVEREARSAGDVLGRTRRAKVVAFPGDLSLAGRFVAVRLESTTGATFRGVSEQGAIAS
ncbi:MAG: MiaB/RimO family radical SAM methylthiotransferase [Gemmatimonadota bacterium]